MHDHTIVDRRLVRASIALVWLYQGLWCKLLGRAPSHRAVISAVPLVGPSAGHAALIAIGLVECGIAAWVISGRRLRQAAMVQTGLLVAMNVGGLIWARRIIPDPVGMVLQNAAFLMLIWVAAEVTHDACV